MLSPSGGFVQIFKRTVYSLNTKGVKYIKHENLSSIIHYYQFYILIIIK